MQPKRNFDGLARVYRLLEIMAFGPFLQKARVCYLQELKEAREVLLVGEGNGLFLKALLSMNSKSRVKCVDASNGMLQVASKRIAEEDRRRVFFEQRDLTKESLSRGQYDAIVTHFFLDCFCHDTLQDMIPCLTAALRPQGKWLLADFEEPSKEGIFNIPQKMGLRMLYSFFKASCGIEASKLSNPKELLRDHDIIETKRLCYLNGWITSAVYEKMSAATQPKADVAIFSE
tara:strand:+ start:1684 stop:2376 length:693 start_codon:yes stop_codon:yes gene_type:complete